jgi:hypothetical protein
VKGDERGAVAGRVVAQPLQGDLKALRVEAFGPIGLVQIEHAQGLWDRRGAPGLVALAAAAYEDRQYGLARRWRSCRLRSAWPLFMRATEQ